MQKDSLRFRTYLFFFVLLFLSGVKLFGALHMEEQSKVYYGWVIHTHEVKELTNNMLAHLIDAETGQRGYLLTEDTSYLEPYLSGIKESRNTWQALKNKTIDNDSQQERLVLLKTLIENKFSELKETIDLLNDDRREDSLNLVKTNLGNLIMDDIRTEIENFNREESRLLEIRRASFVSFQRQMETFFIVETIIFAFVLIILSMTVIKKVISPILKLNDSMKRFRVERNFEPVLIDNHDEIGELASSFNAMAEQAMHSTRDLLEKANTAEEEKEYAQKCANTDSLTGLYNRRYMETHLEKTFAASKRYGFTVSIIMIDIDHFKDINDGNGHAIGDIVLKNIGSLLASHLRESDVAYRYGGEEFLVAITHTKLDGVIEKAEDLRTLVEQLSIHELKGKAVTISLGISEVKGDDHSILEVIHRSDKALYQAKNSGRNKVKIEV